MLCAYTGLAFAFNYIVFTTLVRLDDTVANKQTRIAKKKILDLKKYWKSLFQLNFVYLVYFVMNVEIFAGRLKGLNIGDEEKRRES